MALHITIEQEELEKALLSTAAQLHRDPKDLVMDAVLAQFDLKHLMTIPAHAGTN